MRLLRFGIPVECAQKATHYRGWRIKDCGSPERLTSILCPLASLFYLCTSASLREHCFGSRHEAALLLGEEDDDRGRAHWDVLAGKSEVARLPMDAESGDRVAPLIARVKEIPRRIDIEASRIIASGPCLPGKRQG